MKYDVIVIGCGAAGAAVSWQLVKNGYKVVCVERGDWQDPSRYPSTGLNWEIKKQGVYSYNPNIRARAEDYRVDCEDSQIHVANFNGVGGSTILFSGHFPRLHPSDFRTKSLDGVGIDWPITYQQLEPYYKLNDKMMSVSGLSGDPAYPDIDGMLPPVPIGDYGASIAKGFNALNWHWWLSYSAIATKSTGENAACINLGPCNTGCPQGAKSSVDVCYVREALRYGLKLLTRTVVTKIIEKHGVAEGVELRDSNGKIYPLYAKVVVLACNAVGTARLLLSSGYGTSGLANSSGLVGKNLMMHPLGYVEGLFDKPTDVDIGPQGCCIFSQEFYETDLSRGYARGYTMHVLRGAGLLQSARDGLARNEVKFGKEFIKSLMNIHRRRASIAIICEDLPVTENSVSIDHDTLDSDGLPLVKVSYHLCANTKKMMGHGINNAKKLFKKMGLKSIRAYGPVSDAGWHLLGTTRMGDNPDTSVVNQFGETHDIKRLYVADGSIFPTSGGVNPASSIQAVALYIADNICKHELAEKVGKNEHSNAL